MDLSASRVVESETASLPLFNALIDLMDKTKAIANNKEETMESFAARDLMRDIGAAITGMLKVRELTISIAHVLRVREGMQSPISFALSLNAHIREKEMDSE